MMAKLLDFITNPWILAYTPLAMVAGCWLLNHIFPAWLKFRYDTLLELKKRELLQKDKAAIISDLIVLMCSNPKTDDKLDKIDKHLLDLCLGQKTGRVR